MQYFGSQYNVEAHLKLQCYLPSIKLKYINTDLINLNFYSANLKWSSYNNQYLRLALNYLGLNLLVCAAVSFSKPFYATDLFLYPLKALEDVWFSDVFREYRIRSVASKKKKKKKNRWTRHNKKWNSLLTVGWLKNSFNLILSKENWTFCSFPLWTSNRFLICH